MSRSRQRVQTALGNPPEDPLTDDLLLNNSHISSLLGQTPSPRMESEAAADGTRNKDSEDSDSTVDQEKSEKSKPITSTSIFHSPPPVDPARKTWLDENAEKESYGKTPSTSDDNSLLEASLNPNVDNNNNSDDNYNEGEIVKEDAFGLSKAALPSATLAPVDETSSIASSASSVSSQANQPSDGTTSSSAVTSASASKSSAENKSSLAAEKAASLLPPVLSHYIEKFVAGLKAPRFKSPLQPSAVSLLYQTFYEEFNIKADEYLTQSTLSYSELANGNAQTNSNGSTNSTSSTLTSSSSPINGITTPDISLNALHFRKREIKMETYEEIAEKRRERAMRPIRLKEYNETAEARSTSLLYERLFKPVAGTDVERNQAITQRIVALRSLPLTPKLLDFDIEIVEDEQDESLGSKHPKITQKHLHQLLQPVAKKFKEMDDEQTPSGKLSAFLQGHRLLVEEVISSLYPCKQPPPPEPVPIPQQLPPPTEQPLQQPQASGLHPSPTKSATSKLHSLLPDTSLKPNFLRRSSLAADSLNSPRRSSILSAQQQYQQQQDQQRRISLSSLLIHNNTGSNTDAITAVANHAPNSGAGGTSANGSAGGASGAGSNGAMRTSAAAADSILPLLIYTLVQFDIPDIWLQLAYIMRYRSAAVTSMGENAYPLTNLQAVIGFIETTTLESLGVEDRLNENSDNGDKTLEVLVEESPYANDFTVFTDPPSSIPSGYQGSIRSRLRHHRNAQFSSEIAAAAAAAAAASSANPHPQPQVMISLAPDPSEIVSSADQSIKALGTTFGNSYRFLLSKINNARDGDGPHEAGGPVGAIGGTGPVGNEGAELRKTGRPRHSSLSNVVSAGSHSASTSPPPGLTRQTSMTSGLGSGASSTTSLPEFGSGTAAHAGSEPLLGRLVRTLRSNTAAEQQQQPPGTPVAVTGKLAPPVDELLNKEWTNLTMKDVETLQGEYKRLVEFLRASNAFSS